MVKIELEIADCKMPWAQSASLLRSDFEISQNTIHLKSGAPAKDTLASLDPSLVQDAHWQVLSVISVITTQILMSRILSKITILSSLQM